MDPLSAVQLRILREAAGGGGCVKFQAKSAKRLVALGLVARDRTLPVLFATDAGREWLRKVDANADKT